MENKYTTSKHLHWKSCDLKKQKNRDGKKVSHFYNHLHIGDKPGYYLHGNRLQYLQSQGWKQSEALTSCIFGVKLDTVSVHSPEKAQGDFLAEKQRFLTVPGNGALTKIGSDQNTVTNKSTQAFVFSFVVFVFLFFGNI